MNRKRKPTRKRRVRREQDSSRREDALSRALAERVKELTLLHQIARLLQANRPLDRDFFEEVVRAIPSAWQYSEACAARLAYGPFEVTTPGWRGSRLALREEFKTADGVSGCIEVIYDEARLKVPADPFLEEECRLLKSLADMLLACIERMRGESRIRRLNRTYAVLSGINSAIVRIRDRDKLFHEACRIAVEHGQFGLAWIGVLDAGTGRITPQVWSGPRIDSELMARLARTANVDTVTAAGPTARAVRERRAVYSNNIATDHTVGDRDGLLGLGLHAYIALPLITGGSVIGVMGMHTFDADFFDGEEVKLLEELAADISFSLEYIEKEERVADLAYNEPLTHLPNRASLQRTLAAAVEEAAAKAATIGLILMNLDNFRDINNSLGHANGDLLLQHVARTVRETLWESDRIASLGGDEFALLLPRLADKNDIQLVLEKIRASLQKPFSLAGVPVNIEYTLGIALYPAHGDTADLIWQHADVALRTAKERHETHLFYSTDFDHYDPQRLALIGELRDAIQAGQLIIHFQPIIDVGSGRATALEGLVRWTHPARGLIFPDQFIPLAERTGLINPLTACVVAEALRHGKNLHDGGFQLMVSVNLSARNLHDVDFSSKLLDLVRQSGFPRERLILEITESAIMDDPIRARKVLDNLNGAGIQLSMDDFGIGHSSLSYLKDLPISRIKIDKSFLIGFWQPRNAAIVRSAIELARNLELKVTAEGVEDEATYLELRKLGCDLAQGYYFSKPIPEARLSDWLRNSEWK